MSADRVTWVGDKRDGYEIIPWRAGTIDIRRWVAGNVASSLSLPAAVRDDVVRALTCECARYARAAGLTPPPRKRRAVPLTQAPA